MDRKGSVILHVLVTGVIIALIAACLLRVSMMSYLVTARTNSSTVQKRVDEGALSQAQTFWAANGMCSALPNYTCAGAGCGAGGIGACACTYTSTLLPPNGPAPTIVVSNPTINPFTQPGNCHVSIETRQDIAGNPLGDQLTQTQAAGGAY